MPVFEMLNLKAAAEFDKVCSISGAETGDSDEFGRFFS